LQQFIFYWIFFNNFWKICINIKIQLSWDFLP
jgi:hypothetical protein